MTRRLNFSSHSFLLILVLMIMVLMIMGIGCDRYRSDAEQSAISGQDRFDASMNDLEVHGHRGVVDSGAMASLGRDEYHAEAVLLAEGRLEIFIYGSDETRAQPVDLQTLTAYLKPANSSLSTAVLLNADPLPDDAQDKTSRFSGTLPENFENVSVSITLPGLRIEGQRFTARFLLQNSIADGMPLGVSSDEAQSLYLTAAGLYTEADIEANGRKTAGEFYRGFRAAHDPNPQLGDWLCPITYTKANLECKWIIGGETYYFCCPPCIDEFLSWAKTDPDRIKPAASYRK